LSVDVSMDPQDIVLCVSSIFNFNTCRYFHIQSSFHRRLSERLHIINLFCVPVVDSRKRLEAF
jgi:hypothetical protein